MLAAIGGVSLKHWYNAPEFFWRAGRALQQARGDALCLHASVFPHNGLYFSYSVWQDIEAMLTFSQSGPHRRVLQVTTRLASTYRFCHFSCIAVPSQEQALRIWSERGLAAK
ncbi:MULTISPECIES: hypothetical protein [Alphaproteobacteria]|uniref:hypothetical protein n=1 Tax=Alphaproteobacteria TaxID=28211 RepID=UPI0012BC8927|nr:MULTISPECIES: hypothetical protein [Alphaproteobacteria]MTI02608.1 hypothetical protein [Roseibium sp. RKSG952]